MAPLHAASGSKQAALISKAQNGAIHGLRVPRAVACQAKASDSQQSWASKLALAGVGAVLSFGMATGSPAEAAPFLTTAGDKGPLAEEEAVLYQLRVQREGEARERLLAERAVLEEQARASQAGKLCATPFGVDVVGITEVLLFGGALAGGLAARRRKEEVEKLNEQLRVINMSLRQQARAGTVYAPGLSYAPAAPTEPQPGTGSTRPQTAVAAAPAAVAVATLAPPAPAPAPSPAPSSSSGPMTMFSMEEDEMTQDQLQCKEALRTGKRLLKEQNGSAAMVRFEKALMLSKAIGDRVQERRAVRGLAAASRLTGQHRAAIKHLERVLEISREMREYTGDADAYGVIADCYTDLGEFEKAAKFYDKYIERMNREGPV